MDKGYLEVLRQVVGAQHEGNASKIAQLDGKLSEIRAQLASDPDPINLRWFECQVVERALLETQPAQPQGDAACASRRGYKFRLARLAISPRRMRLEPAVRSSERSAAV
jgi:hypothetical protein